MDRVEHGRLVRAPLAAIRKRLGPLDPGMQLVLCGHSHRSDLVLVPGWPLVLNPGSVGNLAYDDPDDPAHVSEVGTPHARYGLLEATPNGAWGSVTIAVAYDWEDAAQRAERNGHPEWAFALRTGFSMGESIEAP